MLRNTTPIPFCTCKGVSLTVQRVLWTSSQLASTCKESLARSSFREIQSINILVPKIQYHVPHPSNDQNMPKTTSFHRQKRRFLDGVRLQDFSGSCRRRWSHSMFLGSRSIHILGPYFSHDKCYIYTYIGSIKKGSCTLPFK